MKAMFRPLLSAGVAVAALFLAAPAVAEPPAALSLVGRADLPGYSGDFDHFAYDLKGNRLFLAAEDHATLEVFDLRSGEHLKTIEGFDAPHSILYLPASNRLLVTDSGKTLTKVLDGTSYKPLGTIRLTPGADSTGYDVPRNRYYVVTGGKNADMKQSFLAEIDPASGKHYGDIPFDAEHVEAMAVEQRGGHLYINVTDKNYVAVVDKKTRKVVGNWSIKEAEQNALAAMDEEAHRLFVVTRKPGKLLVLDTGTGATVASFDAPGRADQVAFDQANHRIYVMGGQGYIGVYQEIDPDHYAKLPDVQTAAGAKTGILVPELSRLFIAVSPGDGKTGAAVLQFAVAPAGTAAGTQ